MTAETTPPPAAARAEGDGDPVQTDLRATWKAFDDLAQKAEDPDIVALADHLRGLTAIMMTLAARHGCVVVPAPRDWGTERLMWDEIEKARAASPDARHG